MGVEQGDVSWVMAGPVLVEEGLVEAGLGLVGIHRLWSLAPDRARRGRRRARPLRNGLAAALHVPTGDADVTFEQVCACRWWTVRCPGE
jgi:hypothetical protein